MKTVLAAFGLMLAAVSASAQGAAPMDLSLSQDGTAVAIPDDGAAAGEVTLAAAPFEIGLPPSGCDADTDEAFVRVVPEEAVPGVADEMSAVLAAGGDPIAALFPAGGGFAVEPGVQTSLFVSEGVTPEDRTAFNYFFVDRFARHDEAGSVIDVQKVVAAETNLVAQGVGFGMLVGRPSCVSGQMPGIALLTVRFAAG